MTAPTPHPTTRERRVKTNGIELHVVEAGPEDGYPVVLSHGFPELGYSWRHQIPALAAAGHRVIAPDLRGFGASPRPVEVAPYRMHSLIEDVLTILDALDVGATPVVGHDWGSSLGWAFAAFVPERVTRYAALSVGHPNGYLASLRQRELSWYMLWFLFDGVAEEALPRDGWALMREWLSSPLGEPVDIGRYVEDLARPAR